MSRSNRSCPSFSSDTSLLSSDTSLLSSDTSLLSSDVVVGHVALELGHVALELGHVALESGNIGDQSAEDLTVFDLCGPQGGQQLSVGAMPRHDLVELAVDGTKSGVHRVPI